MCPFRYGFTPDRTLVGCVGERTPPKILGGSSMTRLTNMTVGGAALMSAVLAMPAHADPVPYPGMAGGLSANPNPTTLDAGPLGNVKITGALTGIAQWQDSVFPGDHKTEIDLTNGQLFIQKTDGPIQFFVQAGAYSIPDLGLPYIKAKDMTGDLYGVLPQAFVKIVPSGNFSVMVGKLPTLIGAEYT